jgi:hypothetical protein
MIKFCLICNQEIKEGDTVLVGAISTYHAIPSSTTWAIDPPKRFSFVNHLRCEGLEDVSDD